MRNLVNNISKLSPRELEVVQLIAWGAPKKEVAHTLNLSVNTVANHVANILKITGCGSSTELGAAFMCHKFRINPDLCPRKEYAPRSVKPQIIAIALLCISVLGMINPDNNDQLLRIRTRTTRTVRTTRARRRTDDTPTLTF